jgi:hypothetical protein
MVPSPGHPTTLLLLVALSFAAVVAAIVRLFRSGRSVDFPDLTTRFRAARRTPGRGHVPIR